jgi:hypothetical protein
MTPIVDSHWRGAMAAIKRQDLDAGEVDLADVIDRSLRRCRPSARGRSCARTSWSRSA